LSEEERECIWAFQLDGLTEMQACEEYFLSRHVDYNNANICYLPNRKLQKQLERIRIKPLQKSNKRKENVVKDGSIPFLTT